MTARVRPRVKDRETRIREIQAAARKLFFEKGYHNCTVDEVARLADISKGTVYLYFKRKEDLYISLMVPVTEELGERLMQVEKALELGRYRSCKTLFDELLDVYFGLYRYDSEGLRIIQTFQQGILFPGLSEETRDKLNVLGRSNFQTARRTFVKAKEVGLLIPDVDEILLADVLWATFIGVMQLEESKCRATGKDHFRETLQYCFGMIARAVCQWNEQEMQGEGARCWEKR